MKPNYQSRALMLFLKLNQRAMHYTDANPKRQRCKRIMQRLAARLA